MEEIWVEEVKDENGTIEPKVYAPYETSGSNPPRKIVVERLKRLYASKDVGAMVKERLEKLKNADCYGNVRKDKAGMAECVLNRFDVSRFDDAEYEVRKLEEWIRLGTDMNGVVRIPVDALLEEGSDYSGVWKPGFVVGLNGNWLLVEFPDTEYPEPVMRKRLQVCFKVEDPVQFVERVYQAHVAQLNTQYTIRRNYYIDCMPTEKLYQLSNDATLHIAELAKASIQHIDIDAGYLIKEIQQDYAKAMCEIVYDHAMNNNDMESVLCMPQQPNKVQKAKNVPNTEKSTGYADQFIGFSFQTYLTCSEAITVLQHVNEECIRVSNAILFLTKYSRSLKLEEYQSQQATHQRTTIRTITEEWPANITTSIKEDLGGIGKGWYNLQEFRRDSYDFSKLRTLLRRVNFTMQDVLRSLTARSLHAFANFIRNVTRGDVHVQSLKSVLVADNSTNATELPKAQWENLCRVQMLQRPPPLFSIAIAISTKLYVINQAEVDEANRQISEWKPSEEDPNEACPIETILPVEGKIFEYNVNGTALMKCVHDMFERVLDDLKQIKQVEQLVMDKLFWSSHPCINFVTLEEQWVQDIRAEITADMQKVDSAMTVYIEQLEKHVPFLNMDEEAYLDTFNQTPTVDLQRLQDCIIYHLKEAEDIEAALPGTSISLGAVLVTCSSVRIMLTEKHHRLATKLKQWQTLNCTTLAANLFQQYETINRQLQKIPADIEQLTELVEYLETVPNLLIPLAEQSQKLIAYRQVLDHFQVSLDKSDFLKIYRVQTCPKNIYENLQKIENVLILKKEEFSAEMNDQKAVFAENLNSLRNEISSFKQYTDVAQVEQVHKCVLNIEQKLQNAEEESRLYNSREALFEQPITDYDQIGKFRREFEPYSLLWKTTYSWLKDYEKWMESSFLEVNAEALETFVESNWSMITKASKFFEKAEIKGCGDIANQIREKIGEFRPNVPLVLALRNPGMEDRHWEQINEKIGTTFKPDGGMNLNYVLDLGFQTELEVISKIGTAAGKEFQLKKTLEQMQTQWKTVDLPIVPYRETGTYVLRGIDEMQALLDEHITTTQAMQFSTFKKVHEDSINIWDRSLNVVSEVLDEWIQVQRSWLYLQPIFDSPDINKQLPAEGKKFSAVDKNWRITMQNAEAKPNAIQFCNNEKLLERLQESSNFLDQVQKGLSDYLETKMAAFSRFYFLSNDELLSILSESKDVKLVQPHLKKCFEGIVQVQFEDDLTISAMISAEGEKVSMLTPVDPKEKNVENWMTDVESMMRKSVRGVMYDSIEDYTQTSRVNWIQKWPGMCVLNGSQFHWTREMEGAMATLGSKGVKEMMDHQLAQLADMIILVRGKLDKMARITVGALTVIDVHARDVTANLVASKVESKDDFMWSSQLRYYWENDLFADMVAARRPYGYEYLGNSFRLVITPLTDKCYMTLMAALQMTLGGAPAGPAGTGKTETTKDLAKALAKQCVVFNCSDGLDYIGMGKFFKGLASCGAWACFDEFNRINIEVLSVIGQQITTLQLAIRSGDEKIVFEGSEISVSNQFGVFITMNPGYAGRSDLPDSLAALFRPVAMMVPDYAMIGEIMFFAYGYEKAKQCGAKMVTTFKLCSEQLSSQFHYDYGMRAVKTVITAAGNLKGQDPDMDEEILLLRALQDVNLPKFLAHDIPLFDGILSDLFPGKSRPQLDLGALMRLIKVTSESEGLQPHPVFLTKTIQLYETLCVRHGLMLVGPTGGGKSSNIKVLAKTLTHLKAENCAGYAFEKVFRYQLNPKAITMGQLYGEFDANTHEWQDGILSTLYRTAASCTKDDRKWIVFDGPVDAIWIENMNTVLDDNKKLCLSSGEIIQMSSQMTMMFEVEDLSVASPATVSRTGMVYMEPSSLGFDPLIVSWLERLPKEVNTEMKKRLLSLFDQYLSSAMNFMRDYTSELLPKIPNNLVESLMRLLDSLVEKSLDGSLDFGEKSAAHVLSENCEPLFIFCLIWSLGANTNESGRIMFDAFLRAEMVAAGANMLLPDGGLIYDYIYNEVDQSWTRWMDTIGAIEIEAGSSFSEMVIPTSDSVRNTFILNHMVSRRKHVLMVGPTGTGKTVNINKYLESVDDSKFIPLKLTFSAQTSANQVQDLLDSKMEKRRKGVYGPAAGKQFIIYVDDLNMPKQEEYFAQPPIEVLRQWFDQGGWYDRKQLTFRSIIDATFVASMGPPGGGRNPITQRFVRHFNIVGYVEMSDESKGVIFRTILGSFLRSFNDQVNQPALISSIVDSTIDIYNTISVELLPTPAKSHYTFNLRDLAKVFQGVLMASSKRIQTCKEFVRLWIHESQRVFKDRLINAADHTWFLKLQRTQTFQRFANFVSSDEVEKENMSQETVWNLIVPDEKVLYGDYMVPGADPKIYEEVCDREKLVATVEEYLADYNSESSSPMNLVMFLNAIEHVSRISRVLRQPQGNALLLGVGGSGRQSLTRLATYMADYKCFQVEIAKGYGVNEWREDVKKCLMRAGIDNQQVVFLFSDVQIVNETMVEDINNVLNSGDIPNLYAAEDIDNILTNCRAKTIKKKLTPTKLNIYGQYISAVRENLHVVLCMSPIGSAFRDRLRMFPSLVNCCTIDWFTEWPAEALHSVATNALSMNDLKLGSNLEGIVKTFQVIHQNVAEQSSAYYEKLRRYNYVTPTSYLELLSTFQSVLKSKREEVETKKGRLQNGVDKIIATKEQVAGMQEQLVALKPQLEKTQVEVEAMMVTITADKKSADETKVVVEKEEQTANKKAAATKAIADDAQRDLDEALPALESAVQCLNKLKKSDIDEVKAMKNPPHGVRLTMEAACCIFGIKPVMKTDPDKPGQKIKDYWESAKKTLLANAKKLLEDMMNFDKDHIPDAIVQQVDPYIAMEDFLPAAVRKASVACEAICMWVRAMITYNKVAKMVEPKKKALAEAQEELDEVLSALADAKGRLNGVVERLAELEANFDAAVAKKDQLVDDVKQCEIRLESALKLINLLGGEETRWSFTIEQLDKDFVNIFGDIVVSAGTISYLGAFTSEFRDGCVNLWQKTLAECGVPHTQNCSIVSTLADSVLVRSWQICGLPSDNLSVQNGLIMSRARRWPLFIDPQGQANRFIKNLGKENAENGLDVAKLSDASFVKVLENGIRFGKWILVENVTEELDAMLETVLLQHKFKQNGQLVMRLGDSTIPYNTSFRFYMTTKLPSPHYPPETCVKVTLLNFTITPTGLEEQALGVVVQEEMPELAERKNTLVVSNAKMKAELVAIENKILYMLANSKGNILDDLELIETLGQAKVTSEDINEKMEEAEITEKEIDSTREQYRDVAYRASLLFFCIADLSGIDSMYQYSLSWFVELFIKGIRIAEQDADLQVRLENLKNSCTYVMYCNVCRSLFEAHKLLFSFLLTIKFMQGSHQLDSDEWRFLISGTSTTGKIEANNPDPSWLNARVWGEICTLSTMPAFLQLTNNFSVYTKSWQKVFDGTEPQSAAFPGGLDNELTSFQRLCILRCIRPDKVMEGIQRVVCDRLGKRFIEPPAFDLKGSFDDSSVLTPLIFILSSGSDPAKDLLQFADVMKMTRKFNSISLGQGQGALASRMIKDAALNGKWVLLQNCHLAISWMPALERICEEFDVDSLHRDFRLWLTSKPCDAFPTAVLQNGIKMTKEPPKGVRANLRNTYNKFSSDELNSTTKPSEYRKLLFGLSFFHASIIERKKFGPLGWNIPYAFNDTDFDISKAQLEMFLDFYDEVPYKVLRVMTSVVNYGGRVTDDKDMRTIDVILETFFQSKILQNDYQFSESGIYKSIASEDATASDTYKTYIDSLPINPEPEMFGMHQNANITCAITETFHIFDIIVSLQPRVSGGGGQTREEIIEVKSSDIEKRLPELFNVEKISMEYPVRYDESMNTVLVQEIKRYNNLLGVMKSTLPTLQKALKGLVVMSSELEAMSNRIYDEKVPSSWESKAYPSLKALSPWVEDLMRRLEFLQNWVTTGTPSVYWLPGFFFPQGFLTGTLQNYARRQGVPIDSLSFSFIMKNEEENSLTSAPEDGGCYVTGLFLEGARWDKETHSLEDPHPKELFASLPVMHMLPTRDRKPPVSNIYRCPVYKILTRTGTLSTTGHSTNFVTWIEIPSSRPTIWRNSLVSETNIQMLFADQDYWIKAGVACFLSLRY